MSWHVRFTTLDLPRFRSDQGKQTNLFQEDGMEKDPRSVPHEDADYVSPEVERVMDAEELAREVHYAGEVIPVSL
jgi:hypothetical protein